MSCRECGCFTLFKDICDSCKRASSAFEMLAADSFKPPTAEPVITPNVKELARDPLRRINVIDEVNVDPDRFSNHQEKEQDLPEDHGDYKNNVFEAAEKLGIDISELQGVFDMHELSENIENAVPPEPVKLDACQNCTQKIKTETKCPYCGHANNNV